MWDEITYPYPSFNGAAVEVWEWISNFITLYWTCDYLSMLGLWSPYILFLASLFSCPIPPTPLGKTVTTSSWRRKYVMLPKTKWTPNLTYLAWAVRLSWEMLITVWRGFVPITSICYRYLSRYNACDLGEWFIFPGRIYLWAGLIKSQATNSPLVFK